MSLAALVRELTGIMPKRVIRGTLQRVADEFVELMAEADDFVLELKADGKTIAVLMKRGQRAILVWDEGGEWGAVVAG